MSKVIELDPRTDAQKARDNTLSRFIELGVNSLEILENGAVVEMYIDDMFLEKFANLLETQEIFVSKEVPVNE